MAFAVAAVPIVTTIREPDRLENYTGLVGAVFALSIGLGLYWLAQRGRYATWLGFATSIFDVSVVSAVQAAFVVQGFPLIAANTRTTFAIGLLALFGTALRYDGRICVVAGTLAIVQYGAIQYFAHEQWVAGGRLGDLTYGTYMVGDQIGRLIILGCATALAAIIVERTRVLRRSSTHDALTGLQNRSFFEERFAEELLRARRYGRPLVVAMIDVDHFKAINDTWTHAAGDEVLRELAGIFREAMRRTDIVARYGGEEFVMALPETELQEAIAKLESVRAKVAATAIVVPRVAQTLRITITIGVASYPVDAMERSELVLTADDRLLHGKRTGRNRLVSSDVQVLYS
ncbi:MAG: GGDEF domain-containing protein [Gemmatimonadaceae bacterium]|nr:GGDEF domain-containing protein [Gemmatimonadaceae bacterium]